MHICIYKAARILVISFQQVVTFKSKRRHFATDCSNCKMREWCRFRGPGCFLGGRELTPSLMCEYRTVCSEKKKKHVTLHIIHPWGTFVYVEISSSKLSFIIPAANAAAQAFSKVVFCCGYFHRRKKKLLKRECDYLWHSTKMDGSRSNRLHLRKLQARDHVKYGNLWPCVFCAFFCQLMLNPH